MRASLQFLALPEGGAAHTARPPVMGGRVLYGGNVMGLGEEILPGLLINWRSFMKDRAQFPNDYWYPNGPRLGVAVMLSGL